MKTAHEQICDAYNVGNEWERMDPVPVDALPFLEMATRNVQTQFVQDEPFDLSWGEARNPLVERPEWKLYGTPERIELHVVLWWAGRKCWQRFRLDVVQ